MTQINISTVEQKSFIAEATVLIEKKRGGGYEPYCPLEPYDFV